MKKALRIFLILFVLLILGFPSAFMTKNVCEKRIARWICFDKLMNQEVYVLPDQYPPSSAILQKVGAKVKLYKPKPNDYYEFDGFPWVAVDKAAIVSPYVVKVRWDWNEGGLSGEGGETIFLCFFGIPIRIMDRSFWVS